MAHALSGGVSKKMFWFVHGLVFEMMAPLFFSQMQVKNVLKNIKIHFHKFFFSISSNLKFIKYSILENDVLVCLGVGGG
jgi:hypothetical protein